MTKTFSEAKNEVSSVGLFLFVDPGKIFPLCVPLKAYITSIGALRVTFRRPQLSVIFQEAVSPTRGIVFTKFFYLRNFFL